MTEDAPPKAPSDEAPKAEALADQAAASPSGEPSLPLAPPPPEDVPAPPEGPVDTKVVPSATPFVKPNYAFLAALSLVSLGLDLGTKAWAKGRLDEAVSFTDRRIEVVANHLAFTFAKNRGGAWGLLQDEPESIRRPFFLAISVLAIGFIVSLYRKLTPQQWALKWGLPLVLGGALGNLVNRIQYNYVVDFIDYRASWVRWVNSLLSPHPNDHWPTFNIADIAIVAGVVLMAIDMFTPAKKPTVAPAVAQAAPAPPAPSSPPSHASTEPAADAPLEGPGRADGAESPAGGLGDAASKPHAPAET